MFWVYFEKKYYEKNISQQHKKVAFLGKTGRVQFYKAYESAVGNWRKMLTENSLDFVSLIKQADFVSSPQRRESDLQHFSGFHEKQWQTLLERYYFNQQTMMQDIIFQF